VTRSETATRARAEVSRERAGVVRPKAEEKREPVYRAVELNAPNPSLLLGLIEVMEREQERPRDGQRKEGVGWKTKRVCYATQGNKNPDPEG